MKWAQKQTGFTIVELLIVVVVIAILAAITIVAYNGIQNQAKNSSVQNTTSQLARKVESLKAASADELYPASLATAGVTLPADMQYSVSSDRKGYCITGANGAIRYFMTQAIKQPTTGSCTTMDGLIAWWPFNNSVDDISGNALHGTAVGVAAADGQGGQSNTSYTFGPGAQVRCPNVELLRPTAALSISAWVNPTLQASGAAINGIFNYGVGGYWLSLPQSGMASFYIGNSNLEGGSVLALNRWYHVVGTYAGSARTLYVDGVQVATGSAAAAITNYGTETCHIGNIKDIADRSFNGRIDDVRIFNRSLQASEVQSLYTNGAY